MKRLRIAIIGLAAFALAGMARATGPWYVALNGGAPNDGLSWATAYTNVQHAITAASDDDTIYLKGETFTLPVNNTVGKLYWTSKTLTLEGGYAGTIGDTPGGLNGTNTVLRNTTSNTGTENQRILYAANVTNGVLRRVTLRGGYIDTSPGTGAGALKAVNSPGLLLDACILESNTGRAYNGNPTRGGAVWIQNSALTFTNCVLRNNRAVAAANITEGFGGAIHLESGSASLFDSVLYGNQADTDGTPTTKGGAIGMVAGTLRLRNCLLYSNGALPGSARTANNTAANLGDAIYCGGGTSRLEHCTVAYHPDDGIYRTGSAVVSITNSILWANGDDVVGTVSLGYCNIEDGDSNGVNGCISADPRFEYGFYLGGGSPCLNAGSVSAADAGLNGRTTGVGGALDADTVDLGYHYAGGFDTTYANVYVSTNGNDASNGLSAATAFRTVGKALATARDGTIIRITAGTYSTETWPLSFASKIGVQVLGTNSATTILNGPGSGNARIMNLSKLSGPSRLSGLTLRNGYLHNINDGHGGALRIDDCVGLVIDNCRITDNRASNYGNRPTGGGIYVQGSILDIRNCFFARNWVKYCDQAQTADHMGGGIFVNGGSGFVTLDACTFVTNRVNPGTGGKGLGGAVASCGSVLLRNCLLTDNIANYNAAAQIHRGDGLYAAGGVMRVENCTIVTNAGEGVRRAAGTLAVTNSILWANGVDVTGTVAVAWSNVGVSDPAATLSNCISTDPLFINAAAGNYRLQVKGALSPSVNAGNPVAVAWMLTGSDLDGNPRIANRKVDQGAYEAFVPPGGTMMIIR